MAKVAGEKTRAGSRRAVVGTSAALLIAGIILLSVIAIAGIGMNRAARDAEAKLVDNALTEAVNRTLMEEKALAFWGDGEREVVQPVLDTGWLDREFGAYLTDGYGHDEMFILDPANRPIYGYGHGTHPDAGEFRSFQPLAAPLLDEVRTGRLRSGHRRDQRFELDQLRYQTLRFARSAPWSASLVATDNGPAIIAAMTIIDPDHATDARHAYVLLSVVRVDNTLLAAIGRSIGLADLRLRTDPSDGVVPLVADDGRVAGGLSWRGHHPGSVLLARVLPVISLLVVIGAAAATRIAARLGKAHGELLAQESQARQMAMQDPLSGLPNRRSFMDELTGRLARRSHDPDSADVMVAFIDVDRFKELNDAVGHAAGDALITQIGPRIAQRLAPGDMLARLGGDEFAVVAAMMDYRGPAELGEALLAAFAEAFSIEGMATNVTASIGVAAARAGEADPNGPLRDADISLYCAKDAGRGRYVIFEEAMAAAVRERHEIERELRTAIGTPAITMHYQPIFSVRSNAVSGVEALVRWNHPTRGPMNPGLFIPIAEKAGLMPALGDDIIERVLADAVSLKNVDIALNLSPCQLRERAFAASLEARVRARRIDPRRMVIELTETALIESDPTIDENIRDLRERGFRLALDDFGTGFSSLSHLQRFKFDKIKIDQSFVSAGKLERQRPIIQAVVTIGRGFDMEIVAEGIETPAEFAFVQSLGCHQVQGYWLSKPLPFKEARAFLKKRAAELARLEPAPLEFGDEEEQVAA